MFKIINSAREADDLLFVELKRNYFYRFFVMDRARNVRLEDNVDMKVFVSIELPLRCVIDYAECVSMQGCFSLFAPALSCACPKVIRSAQCVMLQKRLAMPCPSQANEKQNANWPPQPDANPYSTPTLRAQGDPSTPQKPM